LVVELFLLYLYQKVTQQR